MKRRSFNHHIMSLAVLEKVERGVNYLLSSVLEGAEQLQAAVLALRSSSPSESETVPLICMGSMLYEAQSPLISLELVANRPQRRRKAIPLLPCLKGLGEYQKIITTLHLKGSCQRPFLLFFRCMAHAHVSLGACQKSMTQASALTVELD